MFLVHFERVVFGVRRSSETREFEEPALATGGVRHIASDAYCLSLVVTNCSVSEIGSCLQRALAHHWRWFRYCMSCVDWGRRKVSLEISYMLGHHDAMWPWSKSLGSSDVRHVYNEANQAPISSQRRCILFSIGTIRLEKFWLKYYLVPLVIGVQLELSTSFILRFWGIVG